jgi:hypothetical protein
MTDKIRELFEKATDSYYEGDFARYGTNEDYVSAQQQDDFMMFCSGYAACEAQHQWLPIESAPYDDTVILITDGYEIRASWVRQGYEGKQYFFPFSKPITHWKPLGDLPKGDK